MKRRLKINGFLIFCAFLLIVIFPDVFLRKERGGFFEAAAEALGAALIFLGQVLRISARGFKSEHSHSGAALIKDGPYALVRNPMYLGILLIGMGIVIVLFNWWVAGVFLGVFIVRYLSLIFKEEKKLEAAFPGGYVAYQQNIPRIFPSLSAVLRRGISGYLPLKALWIKREAGSIIAVLLVTFCLKLWGRIRGAAPGAGGFKEASGLILVFLLFTAIVIYLCRRSALKNGV